MLEQGGYGQAAVRITREQMVFWGLDAKQLWHWAEINTPKLLLVKSSRMEDALEENREVLQQSYIPVYLYSSSEDQLYQTEAGGRREIWKFNENMRIFEKARNYLVLRSECGIIRSEQRNGQKVAMKGNSGCQSF